MLIDLLVVAVCRPTSQAQAQAQPTPAAAEEGEGEGEEEEDEDFVSAAGYTPAGGDSRQALRPLGDSSSNILRSGGTSANKESPGTTSPVSLCSPPSGCFYPNPALGIARCTEILDAEHAKVSAQAGLRR